MAEEVLVSVIIPVFNVRPYLSRCIDSVQHQSYANLEILLIDDGSGDGSSAICDQYAEKDNRIKTFHKENGGLSDARNYGIEHARGEFLSFIDSDDYVDEDYIDYLVKLIKKYNTKLSICQHRVRFDTGNVRDYGHEGDVLMNAEDCLCHMLYHDGVDTSAWAKLYSRDLFENIRFPYGKIFEDIGTTYKFIIKANAVSVGNESKYNYIMRSSSIVNRKFSLNKLDLLDMTDQMAANVVAAFPELSKAAERRQVYARFSTLNQMADTSQYNREKKKIINYIKEHEKTVLSDPLAPSRDKLAIHLLNCGYPVYKLGWKMYEKISK